MRHFTVILFYNEQIKYVTKIHFLKINRNHGQVSNFSRYLNKELLFDLYECKFKYRCNFDIPQYRSWIQYGFKI